MAIIQIKDFSFSYVEESKKALDHINIEIEEGSFNVLCGLTGSGKTTLLNQLKPQVRPNGKRSGEILYEGIALERVNEEKIVQEIGLVFQDPEMQMVTEQVIHELAFALENMEYPASEMQKRIGEMVSFFGFSHLLYKSVEELSGGEKQIVNLAAVLVLRPKVLILDEPLAQLDPVMAENFLHMLRRINEEMGMTIILSEHRFELLLGMADQVIILEKGKIKFKGNSREICNKIYEDEVFRCFVPSISRLYLRYENQCVPLTVKEAKRWAKQYKWEIRDNLEDNIDLEQQEHEVLFACKDIYFSYHRNEEEILKHISFEIRQGDYTILVGANGCGKSTLLKVIAGIYQPQRGKMFLQGKSLKKYGQRAWAGFIGYLAQNPKLYFNEETVEKVIESGKRSLDQVDEAYIRELLEMFRLQDKLVSHPYDLSGGEQQRLALILVLMKKPRLLLLDEPTKGMDPYNKTILAEHLKKLHQDGITILMVTHDLEFAAQYGKQGMMLFDGDLTGNMPMKQLLSENFFYTTPISKVMRSIVEQPIICEEEVWRNA